MKTFFIKYLKALIFFISLTYSARAQINLNFEVRKENEPIYFFQKGEKRDTLSKSNMFYLLVSDLLKKDVLIQTENAQIRLTENDSLIRIQYLPGMKYECWYMDTENSQSLSNTNEVVLASFVNGTSQLALGKIQIKISKKKSEEVLIQNTFYYKD